MMTRKTCLTIATLFVVCFAAADSLWACKFLDNSCHRRCRPCRTSCECVAVADACLPKTCGPVEKGSVDVEQGTIDVTPHEKPAESLPTQKENPAPVPEQPAELTTPTPPQENAPATERAVEPKAATPAIVEPTEHAAPVEPKAVEPMTAEPPKAAEPIAESPKAEPPKANPVTEPETDAFGNAPAESKKDEPVAEPPKAAEPTAEPPKNAPAPEKKEEEKDPFAKNGSKEYRLWTDASGKFQVKARFVGIVDGNVRLQKADGRYVRIEMNLLCLDDQRLVRNFELLAKNW